MLYMITDETHACPMCGATGSPDDIPAVEIGGLVFKSVVCEEYGALPGTEGSTSNAMPGHLFPARWLEGEAEDPDDLEAFTKAFAYVRPPLEPGSAIAEAFGESDARLAWVQHAQPGANGRVRVLIRL